jgi:hypothetical protein
MDLVTTLNPDSVMDIGAGFGKYGVLCREYLELWDGRQDYSNFKRRIDGVEAFPHYITPVHKFVYNQIYVEDILKLVDKLDFNYDLVLLIDVLEHFDKSEGELLLKKLLARNKGVLISTPKDPSDQKGAFGNSFEIHKSKWSKEELSRLANNNHGNDATRDDSAVRGHNGSSLFFVRDNISIIGYVDKKKEVSKLIRKRLVRRINKISFMHSILTAYLRLTRQASRALMIIIVTIITAFTTNATITNFVDGGSSGCIISAMSFSDNAFCMLNDMLMQ